MITIARIIEPGNYPHLLGIIEAITQDDSRTDAQKIVDIKRALEAFKQVPAQPQTRT